MICQICNHESKGGAKFCVNCGGPLVAAPAPIRSTGVRSGGAAGTATTQPARGAPAERLPVVAAVISLVVPGGGQLYNQDANKGFVILAIAVALAFTIGKVGWAAIALWAAYDAHQMALGPRQQ